MKGEKRRIRIKVGPLKPYEMRFARLIERMGWALEVEEWREDEFYFRRFIAKKGGKELSEEEMPALWERVKEAEKG